MSRVALQDAERYRAMAALSGTDSAFRVRILQTGTNVEIRCDTMEPTLIEFVSAIGDATARRSRARRIATDQNQWADMIHFRAIYWTGEIQPLRQSGRGDRPRRERRRHEPRHSSRTLDLARRLERALSEHLGLVRHERPRVRVGEVVLVFEGSTIRSGR
jgi:hypothetical protein